MTDKPDLKLGEMRDLYTDLEIVNSLCNNYEPENFIMNEVLPHALKRAIVAESLIQQKDAKIARLKHIISMARTEHELWENPASAAECMMIWLDKAYETHVQPEQASRLQDEGDTP